MRKYLLYPVIVSAFLGICSSFFAVIPLKFKDACVTYPIEVTLLAVFLILTTAVIDYEVNSFMVRKNKKKMQRLQKEKDSYKEILEELVNMDDETKRLRAIIQFRKDNDT